MNDTQTMLEMELNYESMSNQEKTIIKYLNNQVKVEQLTDPSKKQTEYEQSRKSVIFSLRSLDSETESGDLTPIHFQRTASLNLQKSPLKLKRLSIVSELPLQ